MMPFCLSGATRFAKKVGPEVGTVEELIVRPLLEETGTAREIPPIGIRQDSKVASGTGTNPLPQLIGIPSVPVRSVISLVKSENFTPLSSFSALSTKCSSFSFLSPSLLFPSTTNSLITLPLLNLSLSYPVNFFSALRACTLSAVAGACCALSKSASVMFTVRESVRT